MRHGHTGANEAHTFCGRLDPPLSPQGEAAARDAAKAAGGEFTRVFASGALRARQTAQIVCPKMQAEVLPGLREIDFGRFEGLDADQIAQRMPMPWAGYLDDPMHFVFPGGDDAWEYLKGAEETALALAKREGRILAVSHKGFITAALSVLLHGDVSHMFRYDIRPAGFARLRIGEVTRY